MEHTKIFNKDNKLQKAGGLIIREVDGVKEVLLISSDSRSWSFPKGHLENKETLEEGGVRECKEETGYDTEIVQKLSVLEYKNKETGDKIIVHFYQLKIVGGELQKEYEDNHLKWFTIDGAEEAIDYQNLKDYLGLVKGSLV